MHTVKVRQLPIDSLIFAVMISLTAIVAGLWVLNVEFNPNGLRYAYRVAMRYPVGFGSIAIGLFSLGKITYWLVTGKLFRVIIELTDSHVHHYALQTSVPYQDIRAIEVPRKDENIDVRLIRIRWQPIGSAPVQRFYLDFRLHLRFNKSFQRVLRKLESQTGLKAVEIPWPDEVVKRPGFSPTRLF